MGREPGARFCHQVATFDREAYCRSFRAIAGAGGGARGSAILPIYVRDANGVDRHFRNPIDSAEDAYYWTLYLTHEQSGTAAPKLSPQSQQALAQLKAEYPDFDPSRSAHRDRSVGNAIFGLYLDRKYSTHPTAEEALDNSHEDLRVMGEIDVNQSNLSIRETPSGTNGYTLKVAPIAAEITSPITVSQADGTIVWTGGGTPDAVSIDLSGQPSGMYFVQGLGTSIVVNVVR